MARKILLADDSVTAQNMGRKILADAGYEVITVNNGSAALKKIAEAKPDIIVLDVYMPGYSGLEVCQRIKEVGETSRIPILLTVGKLEPFKPEEAKRVRAEGFIVKPFEASELLNALTKLEDKMVPRQESSKPGRFARAIAAVEERRYDKSVATEEDAGWKNRIAFPTKKKRKFEEPENADDSAIYNPVNKDLRTRVELKPSQAARVDDTRIDLNALTPEGMPKDVTPEEIAALAAAAAQMQGKIAEVNGAETTTTEPAPQQPAVATQAITPEPEKSQPKTEITAIPEEAQPARGSTHVVSASEREVAAFAGPAAAQKEDERPAKDAVEPVPMSANVAAAIHAMESVTLPAAQDPGSDSGRVTCDSTKQHEAEPVTMAVAARVEGLAPPSRWTAVSVALAREEAAIALEDEMRKAYAAYAACVGTEAVPAEAVASQPETQPMPEPALETSSPAEAATQVPTPASPEPENLPADTPSVSARIETVAFKNLEIRAAASDELPVLTPVLAEDAAAQPAESAVPAWELPQPVEALAEIPVSQVAQHEPFLDEQVAAATPEVQFRNDDPNIVESALAVPIPAAAAEEAAPVLDSEKIEGAETIAETDILGEAGFGGSRDAARKESDIAATTAAAWANWRRIRESGDLKDAGQEGETSSASHNAAAMAAAVGAEKAPDDGPEIASIVDSVLADLRPKIVEEISKKLKKKK